jgi:hypothetical protein
MNHLRNLVMKVVKEPIDLVVPNRPYKRPGLGTDPVRWATVTAGSRHSAPLANIENLHNYFRKSKFP